MKKFYAFFAAALMSVSVFAAKDVVPSDAVLADYYEAGNVCACFFVPADLACHDIVMTGTFNGFSTTLAECAPCEPVVGYDGWYVAQFEPVIDESTEEKKARGVQAKPVMLAADGSFNWEYQVVEANVIRGGVTVVEGFSGEIDLITYGTDAPNVFTVEAWKQNPCTAVFHNYVITVVSDGCDGVVVPFIQGGFDNWAGFHQMQLSPAKTLANDMVPTYEYSFKAAENTPYQIVSGVQDATTGEIIEQPEWKDDAYIQVLVDGVWSRLNPSNYFTAEEADIIFDLRAEDLRWARCDGVAPEDIAVSLKAPAGAPEAIEIIGGFDGWTGQAMTLENGLWKATVSAKPNAVFKFRSGVGEDSDAKWKVQIQYYDEDLLTFVNFSDGNKDLVFEELWEGEEGARTVVLDFSDPEKYQWSAPESGVEDIVLTETAKKVMVDGVLYIVRDNKLFNIQGAQVR